MGKVILLFFTFSISLFLQARSPAVEPVRGIAIDKKYQVRNPASVRGYDWGHEKVKSTNPPKTKNLKKYDPKTQKGSFSFLLSIILLAVLPFIIWLGIMDKLSPKKEADIYQFDHYSKKNDDHDDDKWTKAS